MADSTVSTQFASLGLFVFSPLTVPVQGVSRTTSHRIDGRGRAGGPMAYQSAGPGDDKRTINGALIPPWTGPAASLDRLRAMMATGKAWILTTGSGKPDGWWYIDQIQETQTDWIGPGVVAALTFSLSLTREPDEVPENLGDLRESRR